DKVLVYRLHPEKASLVANEPPFAMLNPGSGPRHLAFSPDGHFVYVISEMGSTLTVFAYDSKAGSLKELQSVSTLPQDFKGESAGAEVQVHPTGKFVYGSNRGHDSIADFSADRESGKLELVEHRPTGGKTPRHFAIDPGGKWLLAENQGSDNITVFAIDSSDGHLISTGEPLEIGAPVC